MHFGASSWHQTGPKEVSLCSLCVRKGKHRSILLHSVQYFSTELPIQLGVFPLVQLPPKQTWPFRTLKTPWMACNPGVLPRKCPHLWPCNLLHAMYKRNRKEFLSFKVEMGNAMVKFWMVGWGWDWCNSLVWLWKVSFSEDWTVLLFECVRFWNKQIIARSLFFSFQPNLVTLNHHPESSHSNLRSFWWSVLGIIHWPWPS